MDSSPMSAVMEMFFIPSSTGMGLSSAKAGAVRLRHMARASARDRVFFFMCFLPLNFVFREYLSGTTLGGQNAAPSGAFTAETNKSGARYKIPTAYQTQTPNPAL